MTLIIEMAAFIVCAVLVAVLVGVTAAALMLKLEGSGHVPHPTAGPFEGAAPETEVAGGECETQTLASRETSTAARVTMSRSVSGTQSAGGLRPAALR